MQRVFTVECCADSVESARRAALGGLHRIQLCGALAAGGVTPTSGLLKAVKRACPDLFVSCLIKCRTGNDFVYDDEEIAVMEDDIKHLKSAGADGFTIGALTKCLRINVGGGTRLRNACGNLPIMFHRAFDFNRQPIDDALERVRYLGCCSVLCMGHPDDFDKGLQRLNEIVRVARKLGIKIVIAGDVDLANIRKIVSSIDSDEIHITANYSMGGIPEFGIRKMVDPDVVRSAIASLEGLSLCEND